MMTGWRLSVPSAPPELEICSGGIVGMGEEDVDTVELALRLGELRAEAVPVNFLIPIAGTALESQSLLNPRHCLRALALFRLANPEMRAADRRRAGIAPGQPPAIGSVRSRLDLRWRLPHDQRAAARRGLPDDRRPGVRGGSWLMRAG